MISTGREYDRFVIGIVIVSVLCLAIYTIQCNHKQQKRLKNQESTIAERMDYLTNQVNETKQNMKDWTDKPTVNQDNQDDSAATDSLLPKPVSSGFFA